MATGWLGDDLLIVRPRDLELDRFDVPAHIWQGGHDWMVPFSHGEWLAAHVANACPHLLPEHGHLSIALGSFGAILDEMLPT